MTLPTRLMVVKPADLPFTLTEARSDFGPFLIFFLPFLRTFLSLKNLRALLVSLSLNALVAPGAIAAIEPFATRSPLPFLLLPLGHP